MLGLQEGDKLQIPVYKRIGRGREFIEYKEATICQATQHFYVVDLGMYKISFTYDEEPALYVDK